MATPACLVEVWAADSRGAGNSGSGWVVGGRGVLTAHHVIEPFLRAQESSGENRRSPDSAVCQARLATTAMQTDWLDFDVIWTHPTLDVALLKACDAETSGWTEGNFFTSTSKSMVRLARIGDRVVAAEAIGFPDSNVRSDDIRQPEQPPGVLMPAGGARDARHRVPFDVYSTVPLKSVMWQGMSGGAVRDNLGRLVGLVVEVHPERQQRRLLVLMLEGIVDSEGFAAAATRLNWRPMLEDSEAPQQRWASVLPDRPTAPVERPDQLAALRQALLAADGKTVLMAGMGGAGKSVLAAQMARAVRDGGDDELAYAYRDGVVWVTVGRERAVAAVQLELARAFGEDQPDLDGDWQSGRARLQKLAVDRRGLVVLDDVWKRDRYEPFRLDAPGVQILVTTRNETLADELGGVKVQVGELGKDQSRELLASQAGLPPQQLPAEAGELLVLVGNLALGVAMIGAMARHLGPQAWPGLLRRLRERQLDKIAHKFADNYQHATLLRAIEVAVDDLDRADQQRWAELAVFAGQGSVPESAIAALWQPFDQDYLDTGERINRFLARSLLQAAGQGRYRLHDLQYDVAFLRLGPDPASAQQSLAEVHARLVDAYSRRVTDVAGTPPTGRMARARGRPCLQARC